MRGHLRKRGERSWAVIVEMGNDPQTGRRRQKWVAVKGTKRDAERRLAELVRDLDQGVYIEPTRLSLSGYLDQWMRDYVATSVRPRTARGYSTIVRRLQQDMGQVRLERLNPQAVQRYYASLLAEGLTAQTVLHHHRVLHQALGQAVKWDLLTRNPMERVTPPKRVKPQLAALAVADVQRLLMAAQGTDLSTALHLAVHTGLRRSELCGLQWSDVDLEVGAVTVTRTLMPMRGAPQHLGEPKSRASRRTVAVGESTVAMLRARKGDGQVCARRDGALLTPDALSHGFRKLADDCGLPGVRLHDLRHAHASILLAAGVPVNVVQARMGHESIQTTVDIYGHIMPASDAEAGRVLEQAFEAGRLQNVCKMEHPAEIQIQERSSAW